MKRGIWLLQMVIFAMLLFAPLTSAGIGADENVFPVDSNGKISLDLKGMDVVEVLKTLAAKGSLNIVIGSDVRGRVTMFLKDVEIKDAFEIILLANNLASDKRGDIVYVMTQKEYEGLYGEPYGGKKEARIIQLKFAKAAEAGKAITQIKTKIGKVIIDEGSNTIVIIDSPQIIAQASELIDKLDKPTCTRIFELKYAKAADLKTKISESLTKGVGTMQIDERTNKVVVTDLEKKVGEITEMVTAFDDRLQQVLIEAKILQITLDDKFKLGVDWDSVLKKFSKEISIKSTFELAVKNTLNPGAQIIVGALGAGDDYAVMVQALKEVGDANLLSSPRITALNNQEAKILIGTSQPYATNTVTQGTSTTTTATSLTFIDVGVKLFVTPTINQDGFVTMKIRPEVSSTTTDYTYGTPATKVPIVSTTQAETSVTVKDGTTIVIAGLIKDERTSAVSKIPLLGDIPVLGILFRKTDNEVKKQEMVVFLTPHIIAGDVDYMKQPRTAPMGEKKFTVSEEPTFERRPPKQMEPGYLDTKLLKKTEKGAKVDMRLRSPEEYFSVVKDKIMRNISMSEENKKLLQDGDKVTISFFLSTGGNLAVKPTVTESTNPVFDGIAVGAVEKAAPFSPFPISFKEPKKEFVVEIVYGGPSDKKEKS